MEYQSPFGINFKLGESPVKREDKFNESDRKSLPKGVFLDSEGSRRNRSTFQNWRNHKRDSYSDRNRSFDSDQGNRWEFPNKQIKRMGVSNSPSILDYYHPSMIEDPWKRLKQSLNKGQEYCSSEEHSKVKKETDELKSTMFDS